MTAAAMYEPRPDGSPVARFMWEANARGRVATLRDTTASRDRGTAIDGATLHREWEAMRAALAAAEAEAARWQGIAARLADVALPLASTTDRD